MYPRKAPRQGGKPSMQQVRISTAQVLLASCMRATLFWKPRRWSGLHSRSMPITLSVMLSRRAVSASASVTETVDTSLSLTSACAELGSMCIDGMSMRAPSESKACCTGGAASAQECVKDPAVYCWVRSCEQCTSLAKNAFARSMQGSHLSANYLLHHTLWQPQAL